MAKATTERRRSVTLVPEAALGGKREDWVSFLDIDEMVNIGHLESAIRMLEPIFDNVERALHSRIDELASELRDLNERVFSLERGFGWIDDDEVRDHYSKARVQETAIR